jgi:hypothetical protein
MPPFGLITINATPKSLSARPDASQSVRYRTPRNASRLPAVYMVMPCASAPARIPVQTGGSTMTRRIFIVLLALVTTAVVAAPAGAVGRFGPATTVVDFGCWTRDWSAAAALGGDGIVRGWAQGTGPPCLDERIWFFGGQGTRWTRVRSPYRGRILDAAYDGTGTYLLYLAADGIRVTKRTAGGVFTPGRRLSASTYEFATGAVLATGGSWWAVWTEPAGGGNLTSLFQAKTYGTDQARQRITATGDDDDPELALRPGGGAVLAWGRGGPAPTPPDTRSLRIATSTDGAWASRAFALTSSRRHDLFTGPTHTYLAWEHDSRVTVADNTSGSFRRHTFATPGGYPSVAASGGRLFVTWSVLVDGRDHAYVAERNRGSWTGVTLGRSTDEHEFAWEVTAFDGKATVHLRGARGAVDVLLVRAQQ